MVIMIKSQSLLALNVVLICEFDLSVDITRPLTHLGIKLRLREPVKRVHILILFMFSQSLEYASAICILDPFNFHRFERTTSHNLVYPVHHSHSCSIFQLFDNWACLGEQSQ